MKNKKLVIGLAYDKIPDEYSLEEKKYYADHGEGDSRLTIESIINALEIAGTKVIEIPVMPDNIAHFIKAFEEKNNAYNLDMVFNIAEFFETKNRESIVPAILEGLRMPYTGSDLSAQAKAMNKADSLEIAVKYGVPVAPFYVFGKDDLAKLELDSFTKKFEKQLPVIVKPLGEGTSVGMTQNSVVNTIGELKTIVRAILHSYNQPAMAQKFLDGKEYSVGILGNIILPVLEIDLKKIPGNPDVRDAEVKEIDIKYSGPAKFSRKYTKVCHDAAVADFVLGCRHYNRLDFREHSDGIIYFLETNPLPGLNPETSDFPKIAKMAGIEYNALVNMILREAIKSYDDIPRFKERFDEKRIAYLDEFIEPTMKALQYYDFGVTTEFDEKPEDSSVSSYGIYRLVEAKKDLSQKHKNGFKKDERKDEKNDIAYQHST